MNTRIIKSFLALVCIGVLLNAPLAQQTPAPAPAKESQLDRVTLHQALLDLTNPWTVMCIAAHPDDEDGTSLIVMRRKYGAHTVSLFTTFGEGGQNAIGPELYEELGAIRVRETMAASVIQGSEPHFLGLKDFGYSKSAEETYRVWGHDESLRRMVLHIRKLRPDVIITNHDTSRGHGHHQVTGQLVLEAFDAAADPKRFPEQLKQGVTVWQVQRLFVRAPRNITQNAGQKPDREGGLDSIVSIDPNERDPIRVTTFAEEALRALQKHATQGPWPKTVAQMAARFTNSSDGRLPLIRYRLTREAKGAQPLTPNPDSFLAGLVIPAEMIPRLVPWIGDSWIPLNERDQVLPRLLGLAKAFHQKNGPREIMTMPAVAALNKRLNAAIAAAAGISVDVVPEVKTLVPGAAANFDITITNRGRAEVQLFGINFDGMGMGSGRPSSTRVLAPGQSARIVRQFNTPQNASVTVPHQEHLYDGKTFGEKFTATVVVSAQGGSFKVPGTVSVDVAPAVEIANVEPFPLILTPGTLTKPPGFTVLIINNRNEESLVGLDADSSRYPGLGPFSGVFELAPHESHLEKAELAYGTTEAYENGPGQDKLLPKSDVLNIDLKGYVHDFQSQGKLLRRKALPVIYADAHVPPNLNVGYVRGFDYSLPNALAALGVESKELSVDEVKTADLQKFSAILVDNRVYESQPELIATNQRLHDYAKDGGTLIVFYHKSNEWNPNPRVNRPQLAPYPIILNDERVTDENAPVTFIEPQHQLLNFPNKIGQEDFVGWIQERGLYYPKEWDVKYQALLAMNDPGEAPLRGGLLVADFGHGHYIYTSMVWYRQLRAGVPGAYRMLANMISYGK